MNKRQRKKLKKKLGYKSYYKYRQKKIIKIAEEYNRRNGYTDKYIIYIIDSKRMDLKHIQKLNVLYNPQPVSCLYE